MNELEKLISQKKEIELKIKLLKNQAAIHGFAKIDVEHYPTQKPDRHYLAVYYKPLGDGRAKWQTIFSANGRQEVIDAIPGIASNLQELYKSLTESGGQKG